MSSPKIYTAKDIERYYSGGMTAAERHDIEKAALDDPMLADALAGYIHTTNASADLQVLQNRLAQRLKEKQTGNVFFMGPRWMKIAALFLLLAGGGWLVFQTFPGSETERASSTGGTVESFNREMATDSASTIQTIPPALFTDTLLQKNEVVASGRKRSKNFPASPGATSSAPQSAMSDAAQENKPGTSAVQKKDSDKAAALEIVALKKTAPANTSRNAVDTGRHVDIAQQQSAEAVNETFMKRRMQPARARAAIPAAAEPEGGWQAFEKYVDQNRKPVEEEKKKNTTDGVVILQFDIDNDGNPFDILVLKSLCEKCDAEAIRLLKEGPKWKGKKGRAEIAFSLSR